MGGIIGPLMCQSTTEIAGSSWDASFPADLHHFHLTAGFDPERLYVAPQFGGPHFQFSREMDVLFSHAVEEEDQGLASPNEECQKGWIPVNEHLVNNVQTSPTKHSLEDMSTNSHQYSTKQAAKRASLQDDLALRRIKLDEKAQVIEMLRLGVLTKDEFLSKLAQIEASYGVETRPTPAKRPRLSNSNDVE
ncbi:hypothetical protein MVEN_02536900 [Mycena venus]|uniref:Uncharacterized protein n=1 Tax=Mycena venus TaxID=2733690 RepID=A0A8H6WRQ8_9AGAR|nr:hypothetical protein MVEN_02536900 [Mycena venus]